MYGQLGILVAVASILMPLADLGLTHLALRTVSGPDGRRWLPVFYGLKLAGSLAFLALLELWSFAVDGLPASPAFLLAGSLVLLNTWSDFLRQILRGFGMATLESRWRVAFLVGALAGAGVAFLAPLSIGWSLLALSFAPLGLSAGYAVALAGRGCVMRPRFDGLGSFLSSHGRVALGSMTYLFLVAAIMRLDVWMANRFLGASATGAWLSAYNLVYAGAFLAQGLASIAVPRLMDPSRPAGIVLWKVLRLQAILAAGLFLGVSILGPWVFRQIFRAPGFDAAVGVLPLMGAMLAVSSMMVMAYHLFLVAGRLWSFLWLLAGAVVLKMVLAFLLVPTWGMHGIALSALLSEGPELLVALVWGSRLYLDWRRNTMV